MLIFHSHLSEFVCISMATVHNALSIGITVHLHITRLKLFLPVLSSKMYQYFQLCEAHLKNLHTHTHTHTQLVLQPFLVVVEVVYSTAKWFWGS